MNLKCNFKIIHLAFYLILTIAIFSCTNQEGKDSGVCKTDSLKLVETKKLIAAFVTSNIKSEFFALREKSLEFNSGDLERGLLAFDSTFYSTLNKSIENGTINDRNVNWSEDLVSRAVVISNIKLDDQSNPFLDRKMQALPGKGLYQISTPLFNKNFSLALLKHAFVCGGRCASGKLVLYKKENGVWKEIITFSDWIS